MGAYGGQRPALSIFLDSFTLFLTQGLLLNLEFISSARLSSQLAYRFACLCSPKTEVMYIDFAFNGCWKSISGPNASVGRKAFTNCHLPGPTLFLALERMFMLVKGGSNSSVLSPCSDTAYLPLMVCLSLQNLSVASGQRSVVLFFLLPESQGWKTVALTLNSAHCIVSPLWLRNITAEHM